MRGEERERGREGRGREGLLQGLRGIDAPAYSCNLMFRPSVLDFPNVVESSIDGCCFS